MAVKNWVWPITALYAGPLAVLAYRRFGRPARAAHAGMGHEIPATPFWATVLVGTSHCGAGCTLGDIIAELAIFFTGITVAGSMFVAELIGDFGLAYVLGVAFQYYAIVRCAASRLGGPCCGRESRHPVAHRLRSRTVRLDGAHEFRFLRTAAQAR